MSHDIQKTTLALVSLQVDKSKTTDSEKKLREIFNMKSSLTDYYIEHVDVVKTLLKCCVRSTTDSKTKIAEALLDKVYELLKSDLYKLKSEELEKNNIQESSIDKLEFFNFLYKLYQDKDFIENASKKTSEEDLRELKNTLELILKAQIEQVVKNREEGGERFTIGRSDFVDEQLENFENKEAFMKEAFRLLNFLDCSSKLKQIYYKGAIFTLTDDIKMLFNLTYAKEFKELSRTLLSERKNTELQDVEFLKKLTAVFAGAGVSAAIFLPLNSAASMKMLAEMSLQNIALSSFSEVLDKWTNRDNALSKSDVLDQKYAMLEEDAYYEASLAVRYNSDDFEKLKEMLKLKPASELTREELRECHQLQKHLDRLKKKLEKLQQQRTAEENLNSIVKDPYPLTEEVTKEFLEISQHFKEFSADDRKKLLRVLVTSPEKTKKIEDIIKSSQIFKKTIDSIHTFDELMSRAKEHTTQSFLQAVFDEAERSVMQRNTKLRVASV